MIVGVKTPRHEYDLSLIFQHFVIDYDKINNHSSANRKSRNIKFFKSNKLREKIIQDLIHFQHCPARSLHLI